MSDKDLRMKILHLWKLGLSQREIGAQLDMNRNQVAGRISRLRTAGLIPPSQNEQKVKARKVEKPKRRQAPPKRKKIVKISIKRVGGPVKMEIKKVYPAIKQKDIQEHQCRWPLSEAKDGAEMLMCGKMIVHGKRYCREHYLTSISSMDRANVA